MLKDGLAMSIHKPDFGPVSVVHLDEQFKICNFTHSNPKWVHYLATTVGRRPFRLYSDVDFFKQKSRNGDTISAETPWLVGMQDRRDSDVVWLLTNDFKNIWVLYYLAGAESPEILGRLNMCPMVKWANQAFQSFGHDLAAPAVCHTTTPAL
jgi:hypothetical protein